MRRPLWKTVGIMALFSAVPALCFAGSAGAGTNSQEFDKTPRPSVSQANSRGGACQNNPTAAIKLTGPKLKAPGKLTPLYPPNVARNPGTSQGGTTGLAAILHFLLPAKGDLDKYFKAKDKAFRDRSRSGGNPFRSSDAKQ